MLSMDYEQPIGVILCLILVGFFKEQTRLELPYNRYRPMGLQTEKHTMPERQCM